MTHFTEKSFTVGAKSAKMTISCTEEQHGWPIRNGRGGYKCYFCLKPCDLQGRSVEEVK